MHVGTSALQNEKGNSACAANAEKRSAAEPSLPSLLSANATSPTTTITATRHGFQHTNDSDIGDGVNA